MDVLWPRLPAIRVSVVRPIPVSLATSSNATLRPTLNSMSATSSFSRMYKHLLKKRGIEVLLLKLPKTDTMLDPLIEPQLSFSTT
ncbi:hypothetical protein JCM17961_14170 [Endothiovibrio diazotrophicus]